MRWYLKLILIFLRGSSETDVVEGCGRLETAPTRSKRRLGSAQVVYYVAHQLMAAYPSTAIAWYTAGSRVEPYPQDEEKGLVQIATVIIIVYPYTQWLMIIIPTKWL